MGKLQLKIAFLLSTASELVDFVCNIGQKMYVSYALQFVDAIEIPSIV
jgi:hypothetical protein